MAIGCVKSEPVLKKVPDKKIAKLEEENKVKNRELEEIKAKLEGAKETIEHLEIQLKGNKEKRSPLASKTQECFGCGAITNLRRYQNGIAKLAYYECSECGAELIYHVNDNKEWELFEYTKKDK